MNNSINTDRPDFHCIHKVRDGEYQCKHQCDYCKNHELFSTVKRLQEEKKELVEALIAAKLMMERDKVGGYTRTHTGQPYHEHGSTYEKVHNALKSYLLINKEEQLEQ